MFLIIDGSSLLSTNYYGTLPPEMKFAKTPEQREAAYSKIMQTSTGRFTNGIYMSLKMILDIIQNYPEFTHMAVVFDKTRNTFRRSIDPDYKAQRKPTPAPLKEQFINLERILYDIGICTLSDDIYEADDLAGSIAELFKQQIPVIVMTKDHDYLQLIDENVNAWMVQSNAAKAVEIMTKQGLDMTAIHVPNKIALFDAYTVFQEEGVYPYQIADKKGLCGDSSDNIKGVPGVGESSVIPLLQHYKTIENLYATIDSVKDSGKDTKSLNDMWKTKLQIGRSPFNRLANNKDSAFVSKELATIRRNAPVPTDLRQYKINVYGNALKSVINDYEMASLTPYLSIATF